MKRMMLDLETLSLGHRAVVTAIGAVVFDDKVLYDGALILPRVQPQINMGRTVRWDTVVWWLEQEEAARQEVAVLDINRAPLVDALDMLGDFYRKHEAQEVWGNGSNFDVAIMDTLYEEVGGPPPWGYKQVRDLRTLKSLVTAADSLLPEKDDTVKHSAIGDAQRQAIWAQRLLEVIRND